MKCKSIMSIALAVSGMFAVSSVEAKESKGAQDSKFSALNKVTLKKGEIPMKASKVKFKKNADGFWRLNVNGVETPIRGAGGVVQPGMLEQLKLAGGNFTRTWGINTLEDKVAGGERYVDRAYRLGVNIMPGIWIGHERHGFNYSNKKQVQEQRNKVRAAVRKYKNHPAIVMWGLGNEMEGVTSQTGSIAVWKELEVLAQIIKEEDPNHPVMSIIAGCSDAKIKNAMEHYPSMDAIGVNAYGSAGGAGEALESAGWTKPFAITEFGVNGFWEVGKTSWGAPIEPNSTEKARSYYAAHTMVSESKLCLGTFAFLWGWKQECTATWFGMYLPTMEKLPQVDAMVKAWTGKFPENRCPVIRKIDCSFFGKTVKRNRKMVAAVEVEEPNGDPMTYDWVVGAETTQASTGGDHEDAVGMFPKLTIVNNEVDCVFKTPKKPGAYRLFLTVRDGKGGAATANIPFLVK